VFYKLEEHKPVEVKDGLEFAEWYEKAGDRRIVARDEIGDFLVSTVFLGIDISPADFATPVLFETMVFKNEKDAGMTMRYATWEEAEVGHRRAVLRVRNSGKAA
jgi:hypothetical protein